MHLPRDDAEALGPTLLGRGVKRELHAQADAEDRRPGRDALPQQLVQAKLAQAVHRARKRAHARHHEARGCPQLRLVAADARARADVLERLLHRAAVAHPIVDDRDLDRLLGRVDHHVSVPLVLGTPVSVGSIATAWRSARANALNAASIMWCALLPASTRRCRVSFAALESARKNSSASS